MINLQRRKILFITQEQFGYNTDYLNYVRLLKDTYEVEFFCSDYGKVKNISLDTVYYTSRGKNKIMNQLRFFYLLIKQIRRGNSNLFYIHYFVGCSLIVFFFRNRNFHLDIRTGRVSKNNFVTFFFNWLILLESKAFDSVSVISDGLRKHLKLNIDTFIIPLGANPVIRNSENLPIDPIRLIYIGSLSKRNIDITVKGFAIFRRKFPEINIVYDIVGSGWLGESEFLEKYIKDNDLENCVFLHGYLDFNDILPLMLKSTIGISFIPLWQCYDFQPPTKTFEYLFAGLPVLATATSANSEIITDINGLLINDSADAFFEGLSKIIAKLNFYNSACIVNSVEKYSWDNIVQNYLCLVLEYHFYESDFE